jgi:hypothetical protein
MFLLTRGNDSFKKRSAIDNDNHQTVQGARERFLFLNKTEKPFILQGCAIITTATHLLTKGFSFYGVMLTYADSAHF